MAFKVDANNELHISKEQLEAEGYKPGDEVVLARKWEFPETDEPIGPETRAGIAQGLREIEEGNTGPLLRTREDVEDYFAHLDEEE